jgi:Na+-transporting NADH:ubiquinone oxidoreductase subunit F
MSPVLTVLIAAGAASALMALLAALLVVAERFLVHYGTCTIDINEGKRKLEVEGGQPLLQALTQSGIFIPSACGGRGTCAFCKCRITSGGGPVSPTEAPLLSEEELAGDVRISCQVKVRNDMAIAIPEALFSVRAYRGAIERIRDLTGDIKEVRIGLIEPGEIEFTPGQYIQLEAPPYGDNPESVYRAYSVSSPPSDSHHLETIIRLVPGGICTTWVFTLLKEGDEVRFNGPHGEFGLSDTDAEMVWIAGGSGMAPFWSILRAMKERGIARPTTYYFGAVRQRDMFFLEAMRAMEEELDWFRFVPALSAPEEGEEWPGERGLITEVVDRHVTDGAGKEAYLCGSPGMIDAAIEVLKQKGITDERIFYDKFA